jgi:hypothetical protein
MRLSGDGSKRIGKRRGSGAEGDPRQHRRIGAERLRRSPLYWRLPLLVTFVA